MYELSVTLDERTPAYPGDPKFTVEKVGEFTGEGYEDHRLTMGTHTGTHIDAPAHMVPGGKTLDQFPVDTFLGEAVCIKGFDIDEMEAVRVKQGDIVLFYTGMSQQFYEPEYFTDYPVMGDNLAAYLVEKRVKMVGVDTCSVDNVEEFPIHKRLLGADILLIENLTNLEQLAGKRCRLTALPLKLQLDAAPARVIAEVIS